ncbi:glycoside hydrolase family 65 central catalytic [Paenibacillus curdlanolyticus YK9]|uniref:Glycoside hydrolase family 65 central catalytic n=1 Tax=Paenibacillus curdlanolyticus YK9 TaxID=717606 RepID=E0IF06_9BACL|nr:glycosyl hydrolase family 65 protein [Paenibacillus curdlanolyticus]EFM08782.1 glycoside hydrolase family 65 central catalytic [Paenibacillus curdlanolyticus YK9]
MSWIVEQSGFDPDKITINGNKFMQGNGALGYRGTLEEFTKEQLTACTPAGLYDKVGDQWREPINAPNGLSTRWFGDGEPLGLLTSRHESHMQSLNMRNAVFQRATTFVTSGGKQVEVRSSRFISMRKLDLIVMQVEVRCSEDGELTVETGIDGDVWDINGPHLEDFAIAEQAGIVGLSALTHELRQTVCVAEGIVWSGIDGAEMSVRSANSAYRKAAFACKAGQTYSFTKYVSVQFGEDQSETTQAAMNSVKEAMGAGYERLLSEHEREWERKWAASDVQIDGDDEAQFALRYSLYQLHIIAPSHSEKVSIPARGLSGQVYKGAVFWDTEMFMLPFFLYSQPEIARNLVMYRVHTLEGARRKAAEYGYRGAYFAWESQETGDDACTLFNVTDVFTNRPMRTYFRDKQIHISADAAHGIWEYYRFTGDESALLEGGAEVILECARFLHSYSYYKVDKNRYELLDVTGPDEYHERVNNNAFTNAMVSMTLEIALETVELLKEKHPAFCNELLAKLEFAGDLEHLRDMHRELYVPQPDPETLLIEQFDGYMKLEDVDLPTLKSRILNKNEYLGGGNGLATTTRILKQADVVLMLHLLKDRYSEEVKKANWRYYEPRTEHGSSLSSCIYALVASDIGSPDWAYKYFMKTATIDLTGESKQYVGTLYIGGTHPAANGGAWMAAILGFAGVRLTGGEIVVKPSLPQGWKSITVPVLIKGQQFRLHITANEVVIDSNSSNSTVQTFKIGEERVQAESGSQLTIRLDGAGSGGGLAG